MRVGALGRLRFKPGYYVYVGSAQNNLEKRVRRHVRRSKPLRWHIDYLTSSRFFKVLGVVAFELPRRFECVIAGELASIGAEPVKGFGASDCACLTHLYRIISPFMEVAERLSAKLGVKPSLTVLGRDEILRVVEPDFGGEGGPSEADG